MNASSSVIDEILKAVESGVGAESTIAKFLKRYPQDIELSRACGEYEKRAAEGNPGRLAEIKARLKNLSASRSMKSSGGGDIALKDRRSLTEHFREQERK